jgi:hypothetical protein
MENKQLIGSSLYVDLKHINQLHDAWGRTSQANPWLDNNSPSILFEIKLHPDLYKLFSTNKYNIDGGADFASENVETVVVSKDVPKNHIRIAYYTERIKYKKDRCGCEIEELVVADLSNELNKLFKKNLAGKVHQYPEPSFSNYGQRLSCLHNKEHVELVQTTTAATQATIKIKINDLNKEGKLYIKYINPQGMQATAPLIQADIKRLMEGREPEGRELLNLAKKKKTMGGMVDIDSVIRQQNRGKLFFRSNTIAIAINEVFKQFSTTLLGLPFDKSNGALIGYARNFDDENGKPAGCIVTMGERVSRVPIIMGGENVTITHVLGNINSLNIRNAEKKIQNFQRFNNADLIPLNAIYNEWMAGLSGDSVTPVTHQLLPNTTKDIVITAKADPNLVLFKEGDAVLDQFGNAPPAQADKQAIPAEFLAPLKVEFDEDGNPIPPPPPPPPLPPTNRINDLLFNLVLRSTMK